MLDEGVESLRTAISQALAEVPSADKRGLLYAVALHLKETIDKRVVGAVLGEELRLGRADAIPCATVDHKIFRIYVNQGGAATFRLRVGEVSRKLLNNAPLLIRDIRDQYFGGKEKLGAWTCASHVAARVVLIGGAVYVDKFRISIPKVLARALG